MTGFSIKDLFFTRQALKLAEKGLGWTNPNPMVGAVLVKNGQVIGQGYHKKSGGHHAEIEALKSAVDNFQGATMYVNLEPCSHQGKTSPCVKEIIKSGISRVICSMVDPNPLVRGKGVKELRQAGITVEVGALSKEALKLNETFITFHNKKRPFVAIKFASSLDGKIATAAGDSKWITNKKAQDYARSLRGKYQAVLVGVNTVIKDKPHLGARMKGKKDPIRIVLDSKLRISANATVFRDKNVIIATTIQADTTKLKKLQKEELTVLRFPGVKVPLPNLMEELRKREIISVLVEGGSKTLGSFVDCSLVDKVYAFQAPRLIGGKKSLGAIGGKGRIKISQSLKLKEVKYKSFGDNILTTGYVKLN